MPINCHPIRIAYDESLIADYEKIQADEAQEPNECLAKRVPFQEGFMRGALNPLDSKEYLVWSYETIIATANLDTGKVIIGDTFYSPVTSYHQSLCKAWL